LNTVARVSQNPFGIKDAEHQEHSRQEH
jgi:hypothetical protein